MQPAGSVVAALFAGVVLLVAGCGASCQSTVRVAGMPVIAAGTFDGVVADHGAHRLYLADETAKGVDVVDTSASTPRFLATIGLGAAPHGLAVAPDQRRVYAAVDGGKVAVIDIAAMTVVSTVTVDTASADLIDYDPKARTLYVGSGPDVVVVDTAKLQVTKRLGAKIPVEQPRYDPADGKLYVTTRADDSLLQFDPASGKLTRTYVVTRCGPKGLAINPARQLAMLGCGSSIALVNLATGAHDVTLAVQGADVVAYDAAMDRFVVASPHDARDSAVGVFTGDGTFVGSVAGSPTAHAAAYDDQHGLVYAPGTSGLMSFAPAVCTPPPGWLQFVGGLSIFAAPLLAAAAFLLFYAAWRGRRRAEPNGPTREDLLAEDLEFERARMRALEDSIFGPEAAP